MSQLSSTRAFACLPLRGVTGVRTKQLAVRHSLLHPEQIPVLMKLLSSVSLHVLSLCWYHCVSIRQTTSKHT